VGGDAEEDHARGRRPRLGGGLAVEPVADVPDGGPERDGDRLWVRVRRFGVAKAEEAGLVHPESEPRPVDQFEEPEVAREEVVGGLRVANVGKVWERAHGWAMMGRRSVRPGAGWLLGVDSVAQRAR